MHRELLQRGEIGRDILANGSMRATARLDGGDALIGERTVAREEFGVLPRLTTASGATWTWGPGWESARAHLLSKDVIRHNGNGQPLTKPTT